LKAGHRVSPIPGPASPIAALTASGLSTDTFLYLGYLPRKSTERKKVLEQVADLPYTLIFLETPHRLIDSLEDLESVLGTREIAVARELTKLHEEIWRGKLDEAREYFKSPRGEFVLVVEGKVKEKREKWGEEKLLAVIRKEIKAGATPSTLAAKLAAESGWPRREIYKLTTQQG
jgi:16S rRNA (cytidine1402-2'-O)-methyltransferase